jgi:hypothetical protein
VRSWGSDCHDEGPRRPVDPEKQGGRGAGLLLIARVLVPAVDAEQAESSTPTGVTRLERRGHFADISGGPATKSLVSA